MDFFQNEKMFQYLPWSAVCKFSVDDKVWKNSTFSSDLCCIYSPGLFSGNVWSLEYLLLKLFIQNNTSIWESKITQININN